MVRFFFLSVLLLTIASGCREQEYLICQDKLFDEVSDMAHDTDVPFCIILHDSLGLTPNEYIDMGKAYKIPTDVIYNFVDIDLEDNKWYTKLLRPQIYPVTCVFDASRRLIDLIPGSSMESFAYITKAIDTQLPCAEFHYDQKYDNDKLELIRSLNRAITLKQKIDNTQYVVDEVDSLFQNAKNPYILYLKLRNQIQFKDTNGAKKTAEDLLLFDSARDLSEYHDEFMIANQLLDSTYNSKTAPRIETTPIKIELSECVINQTYNLDIDIINKGEKPLKISDILTSCSCVKLISSNKHIIDPKKSVALKVAFTPDAVGDIFREIYIASNSIDTPIYIIPIYAAVQE